MAFTQADLDRLNQAIASGVRKVTYEDGRSREFQNLDQMLAAKRVISAEITMASSTRTVETRRRLAGYSRGL